MLPWAGAVVSGAGVAGAGVVSWVCAGAGAGSVVVAGGVVVFSCVVVVVLEVGVVLFRFMIRKPMISTAITAATSAMVPAPLPELTFRMVGRPEGSRLGSVDVMVNSLLCPLECMQPHGQSRSPTMRLQQERFP